MKGKRMGASRSVDPAAERRSSTHTRDDATFPISSPTADVPNDHSATFADINQLVLTQRRRVVIAAHVTMVELSPRNLKYMRAFAAVWPDAAIVQAPLAQITSYHDIALLHV